MRRRPALGRGYPATADDPLASERRSSLLSRFVFFLLGLITIVAGAGLLASGLDAYLGAALIASGLVRFVGIYLEVHGLPGTGFLVGNATGALLYAAAVLDVGNAVGLDVWALVLVGMPLLIMGPQHAGLRPVILGIGIGTVTITQIVAHAVPPRIVVPPDLLPAFQLANLAIAIAIVAVVVTVYRRMLDGAERQVVEERRVSERLLANILPAPIAARLKRAENPIAEGHAAVTILFADMVNFTEFAAHNRPEAVVALLNRVFYAFDDMVERRGLEKIKTIGDAYMVAGGLSGQRGDAAAVADLAFEMLAFVRELRRAEGLEIDLRAGIHTGPLVAGVIGKHKFSYDVWGDTVNIAARLETASEPGRILVSEATARAIGPAWRVEPCGIVALKGVGDVPAYFLLGRAETALRETAG